MASSNSRQRCSANIHFYIYETALILVLLLLLALVFNAARLLTLFAAVPTLFETAEVSLGVAAVGVVCAALAGGIGLRTLRCWQAALRSEIARREEAQKDLRSSEERFRLMTEYGSDIITLLDADGCVLYESPSVERVLGYPAGERTGRSCFADMHRDDLPGVRARFRDLVAGTSMLTPVAFRYRHRDGSWRYLEAIGRPLPDDSALPGFIVNSRDITSRKEAEDALKRANEEIEERIAARTRELAEAKRALESELAERRRASQALRAAEERYRGIFENAGEGIFQTTADGRYLCANPALARIYGYRDADDLMESLTRIADQLYVRPGRRDEFVRLMNEHDAVPSFESEVRRKDGSVVWIAENVRAVRDAGGNLLYYEGLVEEITERKRAEAEILELNGQLQRRLDRIAALRRIDQAITSTMDLRLTLGVALTQVLSQLRVDAADVLLYNRATLLLERAAGQGFLTPRSAHCRIPLAMGMAGRAVRERRMLHVPDLSRATDASAAGLEGERFRPCWIVPLEGKGHVTGVLRVFHRAPLSPDDDWREFLEMLAGQVAIAVDNADLFENLQRSNEELMQAYDATIEGWSRALDLRDRETEGHSRRVTEMTLRLARRMGLGESHLVHVRRGALLHDIGKMGIPDHVLLKPGPLNNEEWGTMRRHPVYAYEMLSPVEFLHPALDIPYAHHERWDGTGYPRGLKGEQIPLAARLFAVVDVWDALCSDRPYRRGWPIERVREHIRAGAGTHFDPRVVEAFLHLLSEDEERDRWTTARAA